MELIQTIAVQNTLGEGVSWDALTQSLWWTDIQAKQLHKFDWRRQALTTYRTPERLCSFGFIEASAKLVAAFESGFAIYDPASGDIEWLDRPEAGRAGIRFNDGRVDRRGQFWAGTMEESDRRTGKANLYCLDSAGRAHRRETGIAISNGICWSPDGGTFYFADSPTGIIHAYDVDARDGAISNRRVFAQTPQGFSPDGANVDAEGCVWSAQWGGGRVIRYAPDGRVLATLDVPANQATCVAFGGPDLDLLFVTSARDGLSPQALADEPSAGDVFVYKMTVKGLADRRYILDRRGD
jgi:sugar lactone lactonase YvrE